MKRNVKARGSTNSAKGQTPAKPRAKTGAAKKAPVKTTKARAKATKTHAAGNATATPAPAEPTKTPIPSPVTNGRREPLTREELDRLHLFAEDVGWPRRGLTARLAGLPRPRLSKFEPHDRTLFLLGFALALPLVILHTHVILGDADSARLLASIKFVQREGFRYLIETQEPLLPHAMLGPVAAVGGIGAIKWFLIASLQVLAGTVSFITWRLTRSVAASVAAVLGLLSFTAIPERAGLLPMYAPMLTFGILGTYLALRATETKDRDRLMYAVLAGACMVLSAEAHGEGQIFFVVPALLLFARPSRWVIPALMRVYAAFAAFFLPRAIINLADGGISHFFAVRVDYWVTKGYIDLLQKRFFVLTYRGFSLPKYIGRLAGALPIIFGVPGLVVCALAVAAFFLARGRSRWFGLAAFLYFLGSVLSIKAPFFARYYSPGAVGLAIAGGTAAAFLQRRRSLEPLAWVVVAALLATSSVNIVRTYRKVHATQERVVEGPFNELAQEIDDGKGVIGPRSMYLLFDNDDVKPYGTQFLTEEEFKTYLTWPSDAAVLATLQSRDIGWALIHPGRQWETDYNDMWLVPTYGLRDHHVKEIAKSPNFCLVYKSPPPVEPVGPETPDWDIGIYLLYRVGPCDESRVKNLNLG